MADKKIHANSAEPLELLELVESFNAFLQRTSLPTTLDVENVKRLAAEKPADEVRAFYERLKFFYDVCVHAAGDSNAVDGKRLLWSAIQMLGVRPTSDLMDRIRPGDFIEIYDRNNIQVFRDFEFCRLITYTLDQVLTHTWDELYERTADLNAKIFAAVERLFTEAQTITDLGIPTHVCNERMSGSGRSYEVTMKFFSPLFEGRELRYLLAVSSIARLT